METLAPAVAFLIGLGITLTFTVGSVVYLHRHLVPLLVELCGTRERAAFWAAFTNTLLIISPMVGALVRVPVVGPAYEPIFEIGAQLAAALLWLGLGLLAVGAVLTTFIRQATRVSP